MTVFVAGIHGVGKSYLCQRYARAFSATHESASGLIRKERALPVWGSNKRVVDIADNQTALRRAVQRIQSDAVSLLLDGHFVLINENSEFVPIDIATFCGLNLSGVVLLEAKPEVIASRLSARDSASSVVDILRFIEAEREHAALVCNSLGLPMCVLNAPEFEDFSRVVFDFFKFSKKE